MQVASSANIQYISLKDIPQTVWDSEIELESKRDDVQNKAEAIKTSIIKGRVEKTLKTFTLLNQFCIRETETTVEDYIKKYVALLGENIQVTRFSKFVIGQSSMLVQMEKEAETE